MVWISTDEVKARPPIRSGSMTNSNSIDTEEHQNDAKMNKNKPDLKVTLWEKLMCWGNMYLHILPQYKICYYILSLLMFSAIATLNPPHFKFLTGKFSILNQVFVKLGWLWTFGVYLLYKIVSLPIHTKPLPILGRLCVRYLVTTFFFYIWCQVIFPRLEYSTGTCSYKKIKVDLSKRDCVKRDDHVYHSFDISGHSYLLTYCVLILMEESLESLYFIQLARYLRKAETVLTDEPPLLDRNEAKVVEKRFTFMAPIISLSYVFVIALSLLWDFMLIITTIYYHTFIEKLIGSFLAVLMWYFLYRRLFPFLLRDKQPVIR